MKKPTCRTLGSVTAREGRRESISEGERCLVSKKRKDSEAFLKGMFL